MSDTQNPRGTHELELENDVQVRAIGEVISWARVSCATLEALIDERPVEMWVRVLHDKLHRAIEFYDYAPSVTGDVEGAADA